MELLTICRCVMLQLCWSAVLGAQPALANRPRLHLLVSSRVATRLGFT